MAKNIIGVDISDFSIEAIALEKSKGGFKIESYARFRLSPEIVEDGKILNKQKLKDVILKMFQNAKPHPFDQSRKVFLSIPESQTFSKVLSLPKNIKDRELKKVALNKAEELIPESIDKLTAIVKILPSTEDKKRVFYSAAETDVLKNFISVFRELDISVVGITTETISSFAGLKKDKDKKVTLLLDLGARTTIASIFSKECLCSSININIGGDNISQAIAKKLNISYVQAEDKKRQIGLMSDGDGETMLISQGQLQPLVDELKVFIKYWQDSSKRSIEQVILIGGLSQMKGADKYFGDNLNLPTQLGQPFIDVKDLPEGLSVTKYINALGLAKLAQTGTEIDFYKNLTKESKSKSKDTAKQKNFGEDRKIGRFSKKTIASFIVIFVLLLSAAAIIIFRDQLTTLIYKDNNKQIEEIKKSDIVKTINEEIIVNSQEGSDGDNVILGEIYEINVDKSLSIPELPYLDLLDSLEQESNNEILIILNDKYPKDGYYIIPRILSYESTKTIPLEADFRLGDSLRAIIKYEFLSVSEEKVNNWLFDKYPNLSSEIKINYKILSYSLDGQGHIFKLNIFSQE